MRARDFITTFSLMVRLSRPKKKKKKAPELCFRLNERIYIYTYKTFYQTAAEYILFSSIHGPFSEYTIC